MMKTAVKSEFKAKTFLCRKNNIRLRKKEMVLIDYKFYQKLFVVLISMSTFLIFPESPKELENICESYNSTKSCNVW